MSSISWKFFEVVAIACPCRLSLPCKAGFSRSCGQLESAHGLAATFGVPWLPWLKDLKDTAERRKKDTEVTERQEILEL